MSELAFRQWYLNYHFQNDNLSLSERITAATLVPIVAEEIRLNLEAGLNLVKLTKALSEYTVSEDLPQGIREVISMARRVSAGDGSILKDFTKVINSEKSKIAKRMEEETATLPSVLTKSYNRLIKAAEKLKGDGLEKAIENAIEKKAASNAFRIAITESARAYGVGMRTRAGMDEECTGITWDVSEDENNCDECLSYDGITFPKDELPDYPAHPNCHCNLSLYYLDDVESQGNDIGEDTTIPESMVEDEE
jgi:hypothetical protein